MDDLLLQDIEAELDLSVESSAIWLEDFLSRMEEELDEDDFDTLATIVQNLYDCSDYIRSELGIGGEVDDEEEDEDDEDYDPHLPAMLDEQDEDDYRTFVGTWDSIRFLEDEYGEITGIQVDFA